MGTNEQPLSSLEWVHRDTLHANAYNPNRVQLPEMKLLKLSIMEDGWTQPIVARPDHEIVDGFHRWTLSADSEVYALTDGLVPVVRIEVKDPVSQMMATIRHNRARGTHLVLKMSDIVADMVRQGVSKQEIQVRLQMEAEEVVRLALRAGIPETEMIQDHTFGKAWVPE